MMCGNYRSYLLSLVVLFASLLAMLSGCKKNEEAKSGVVGQLTVEGDSPEGATVMLFEDPSNTFSDAIVWYTTARQPQVGFPYNPQADFDWRTENSPNRLLRATTTVSADGEFNIADQTEGDYFLVVEKSGFGWTAPISVNLNQPTVNVGMLRLYPEEELSGATSGNRILLTDHHYFIPVGERFQILSGDTLKIEPGAVIRGDDGAEIRIQGSVISEGLPNKWIIFTSNWHTRLQGDDWEGLSFQPSGGTPGVGSFRYTAFTYCFTAIRIATDVGGSEAAECVAENCYFTKISGYGFDVSNSNFLITHCAFNNVPNAIRSIDPDSIRIEHNIVWSATNIGVELEHVDGGSMFCNWFHNCGRFDTSASGEVVGVTVLRGDANLDISYNNFQWSSFALHLRGGILASTNIHHNRFFGINRVMEFKATPGFGPMYPTFQYNCLTQIDNFCIYFDFACRDGVDTVATDARFNYWSTLDPPNCIRGDCVDNGDCPCVDYIPVLTECPQGAGICAQ